MSVLPISKDTIVYGSNDYGATIHSSNDQLIAKVKEVAKYLNLKPHIIAGKELYTPIDMEGHVGRVTHSLDFIFNNNRTTISMYWTAADYSLQWDHQRKLFV
jgi:hypothetical protein